MYRFFNPLIYFSFTFKIEYLIEEWINQGPKEIKSQCQSWLHGN